MAQPGHNLGEAGEAEAGQNRSHNDKQQAGDTIVHRQQRQELPEPNNLITRPPEEWWSRTGSNRRHPACKAGALPAELRPQFLGSLDQWWAWEDLNLRPHAYQARALTN